MKLIILGAGASHGASRHADVKCPLVGGILAAASKVGLLNPEYSRDADARLEAELRNKGADDEAVRRSLDFPDKGDHLMVLREFINQQFGLTPDRYETAAIDFERLFALVEAELLGFHGLLKLIDKRFTGPRPADVLEMQLFLVLCGSIISAIRDLTCEYHDAIAQWLIPGDVVLSFNYDLLIDRSLKKRGDWFVDDGYGLRFAEIGRRADGEVTWRKPRKTASAVGLLKPHGSLNWLYPRDSRVTVLHADVRGFPTRTPPRRVYCLEDIHARFEEDHPVYEWWERYDISYRGYMFDLHSVIVPPSISKPYRSFEPLVGSLWAQALDRLLRGAKEIYFVGFSLRPDDARAWWLFRKAVAESRTLERAFVVDPSDEVFERIQMALSPLPVARGPATLAEFVKSF